MLSQKATSEGLLNPNKSKTRGLIRVPQGKICRMASCNQDYDGLYTDDFLSCNIIVVHNKKRMSMIHADSSIDLAVIESEKKWVGEGANIKVFFKENGIALYKQIFGAMPKVKPISEKTKAISARFFDGAGLIEALADKPEKTIRHPQENRLETVHNINAAFFYLLHPAYGFNEKIKTQWKEKISKVMFDDGFWLMPNTHACDLHTAVSQKIAGFKAKSLEEIQEKTYQKMRDSIEEKMDKMLENERIAVLERMTRISSTVAESVWCYYNEYKLHENAVDSKAINEAYDNINRKREEIKRKCQKIYDGESYDFIVTNFKIIKPFVKKFFCKEEGIVLALENKNISFIDFMEMRITRPLDAKQLLEPAGSVVLAEPSIIEATSEIAVPDAPAKLAKVLPALESAVKTENLGSKNLANLVLKSAENALSITKTVHSEENTVVPAKNKVQKKLELSDFPLIQAKKTEVYSDKPESKVPWLPAPTRKKPVLQPSEKPRTSSFLSARVRTVLKDPLKVVSLAPQAAGNRNITVPPKDEHHFPALGHIKTSRKPIK
ncbi:MAG TPA: hypothetical protein VNK03_00845 [Gammaproteobacteria bacterium]|nr:hypothetical protein [Gammaproteobacteria bacterium]